MQKTKTAPRSGRKEVTYLEWYDILSIILTIISFFISVAGLIITIFTLKKAGSIEKAVHQSKAEQMNKMKYVMRRQKLIDKLNSAKGKLTGDTKSLRSSGEIKNIFMNIEEAMFDLSSCCDHFSDKHKIIIRDCTEYITKTTKGEYILGEEDSTTMRNYIIQILGILRQEEYFI